ncbi:hypothetical protein D3C72_529310 [compost metagenome]
MTPFRQTVLGRASSGHSLVVGKQTLSATVALNANEACAASENGVTTILTAELEGLAMVNEVEDSALQIFPADGTNWRFKTWRELSIWSSDFRSTWSWVSDDVGSDQSNASGNTTCTQVHAKF